MSKSSKRCTRCVGAGIMFRAVRVEKVGLCLILLRS